MRISMSNNPLDKLSCYVHNRIEDLSQIMWIMGKEKKVKCKICGNVLHSWRDMYSPIQCGWGRIDRYTWVCHKCLEHRKNRGLRRTVPILEQRMNGEYN